jgi:hypothetical protein
MEREEHMTPSTGDTGSAVRSPRRWRLRLGAALSATVVLASSGLAQGIEIGTESIRVRGAAMGLGAHFVFSRPGTAPMEPVFDVSFGTAGGSHDQLSDQNSGFAASFYPGAVPSTPGSVLGLAGFPVGGQIFPSEHPISQGYRSLPGLIPPWPLATQGSYPGDPGRRVDLLSDVTGTVPAPLPTDFQGMTQETVVDQDVVSAKTNIERLGVTSLGGMNPGLEPLIAQLDAATKAYTGGGAGARGNSFTLKGLNARYESVNTGQTARSTAEVTVREVDILGGLLNFFRVRSLAEYAGDAQGAKLTAHTAEVGLARMLGLEVAFDDRGVKLTDKRIPTSQGAAVTGLLEKILDQGGFKVQTTAARVEGTKVDAVALRFVMSEQEGQVPGTTFFGRKTTVTFEVGALGSNFETLPGSREPGGALGTEPTDGGPALGVALPASGVALASPGSGPTRSAGEPARAPAGSGSSSGRAAEARRVGGLLPALTSAAVGTPGPQAGPEPATEEVAAPPAAGAVQPGLARSTGAKVKPRSKAPLLLLPGVAATDAQQREIASGIQDIGRRLAIFAGLASLVGVVVWRRRRGILQ